MSPSQALRIVPTRPQLKHHRISNVAPASRVVGVPGHCLRIFELNTANRHVGEEGLRQTAVTFVTSRPRYGGGGNGHDIKTFIKRRRQKLNQCELPCLELVAKRSLSVFCEGFFSALLWLFVPCDWPEILPPWSPVWIITWKTGYFAEQLSRVYNYGVYIKM